MQGDERYEETRCDQVHVCPRYISVIQFDVLVEALTKLFQNDGVCTINQNVQKHVVIAVQALQNLRQIIRTVTRCSKNCSKLSIHVNETCIPSDGVHAVGKHGVPVNETANVSSLVSLILLQRVDDGFNVGFCVCRVLHFANSFVKVRIFLESLSTLVE